MSKFKAIALATVLSASSLSYITVDEKTFTVKDKERIGTMDGSYYLVFTDGGVFKNEDTIMHMKFDSSEVYGYLEAGERYTCKTNWFRFPLFSMYRNIIDCKKG